MAFDPKSAMKTPAFGIAGGVVVGFGVFEMIKLTVWSLFRPFFNVIGQNGTITLSSDNNIYMNCGEFLSAIIVAIVAVIVGMAMIGMAIIGSSLKQ